MKNLALVFVLAWGCQPSSYLFEGALCIKDISTIDAEQGLQSHQTVVLKDGKIIKIAPTDELPLAEKNEIVSGVGKFVIPGLWDAHVHFAYIERMAPRMFDLFLAYGITSVRDTGGKIEFVKKWKDKSLADPTRAPRVMIAGPLLDGMPNVYDGSDAGHPPLSVGLNSVEAVTEKINELNNLDVDLLKAYEMLTPEQFAQVIKIAGKEGLKVTGHVPLSMDVISASNAGLNSMEHMRNLELSCASNAQELLRDRMNLLEAGRADAGGVLRTRIHQTQRQTAIDNYDEAQADRVLGVLARNNTWQIPTIALNSGLIEKPFMHQEWQSTFKFLSDSTEQQWKSQIESIGEMEQTPFRDRYTNWMLVMVDKINKAKIDIMVGTDCPIFFLTPGRSLHQELAILVKAGLSPLEAIETATLNPARYFNMEDELGLIRETYLADLLILDANPLAKIENTLRINAVVKQGKYYDRQALDKMLENLAADNLSE